jgi:O-antigen/teichoic acid export membrane protein
MKAVTTHPDSLKRRFFAASGWITLGSLVSNVIRLFSNVLLTRLLEPEAFGLMAIVITISVILEVVSDIGVRQSILRSTQQPTANYLATAWTLQFARGGILWLSAITISFLLYLMQTLHVDIGFDTHTYSDPRLPLLIACATFTALINGAQSLSPVLAARHLDQRQIIINEFVCQLVGVVTMALVAWQTRSVYALVCGQTVVALVSCAFTHLRFKPRQYLFKINRADLHDLLGRGRWLAVSSAFGALAGFGDRLILGTFVDAKILGMFSLAMVLVSSVDSIVGQIYSKTIIPALNSAKDIDSLRHRIQKIRSLVDPLLLILAGGFFFGAELLVGILYDGRYAAVAGALQALAPALLFSRFNIYQQVFIVMDKPKRVAMISTIRAVMILAGLPLALSRWGFLGGVWLIALRDLPVLFYICMCLYKDKLLNIRFELLLLFSVPIGAATAQGLVYVASLLR